MHPSQDSGAGRGRQCETEDPPTPSRLCKSYGEPGATAWQAEVGGTGFFRPCRDSLEDHDPLSPALKRWAICQRAEKQSAGGRGFGVEAAVAAAIVGRCG